MKSSFDVVVFKLVLALKY
ncbi:hypothetical protein PSTG_19434 [Puccinia striiformis f. sp. tritici PST-78]|uniref:Uncharacterized protein n=1 Tax=Puccinia striiformis f. sp. tritici PST-78 TaxID=1165861 RepID=A0A0L0UJB7_9BASI|nr:hypothetical protein PSTG_19434 [Puccinia striiformis f. sp. tritici PST-78]